VSLSMRSFLVRACRRSCPRRSTLHPNREHTASRRFGSADFWQHLIMVDTDDPRAAPLRGLEEERLLGCLLETKKNRLRENFRFCFRIRSKQRPDALLRELS